MQSAIQHIDALCTSMLWFVWEEKSPNANGLLVIQPELMRSQGFSVISPECSRETVKLYVYLLTSRACDLE